jgi:hypothetical protein
MCQACQYISGRQSSRTASSKEKSKPGQRKGSLTDSQRFETCSVIAFFASGSVLLRSVLEREDMLAAARVSNRVPSLHERFWTALPADANFILRGEARRGNHESDCLF